MFDLDEAVAVLTRTPAILDSWLGGLEAVWTDASEGPDTFSPFDDLLVEFSNRRDGNLKELRKLDLLPEDFRRTGLHPELGPVTLGELLATWVVHDLNHIGQVARVMARRYENEVGPWVPYLTILG